MDYRFNNGDEFVRRNSREEYYMHPHSERAELSPDDRARRGENYTDFVNHYPAEHGNNAYEGPVDEHQGGIIPQDNFYTNSNEHEYQNYNVPTINVHQAPQAIPLTQESITPMHPLNFTASNDHIYGDEYNPRNSSAQSSTCLLYTSRCV